jgi:hypothetical protein
VIEQAHATLAQSVSFDRQARNHPTYYYADAESLRNSWPPRWHNPNWAEPFAQPSNFYAEPLECDSLCTE